MRMDVVREILRLTELGCKQREIHRSTGVARSCIQKYLGLLGLNQITVEESQKLTDLELKERLNKKTPGRNRAEIEDPDFQKVHEQYLSRKGVTLDLLWQEWVQVSGIGYSYQTFCRRYDEWASLKKVTLRSEYRGGEKLLVDYAGEALSWWDEYGEQHKVEIFVSVLGASNYIYAEASPSQRVVHWISSNMRAFEFIGGVTEALILDNLKSGVIKSSRYEPELNKSFEEFGAHYNVAIVPTRAAKPRDKAKVEKAVQDVERWVLAPLRNKRFGSLAEINLAMAPLLEALNGKVMQSYQRSRKELFEELDKPALKPLPTQAFVPASWKLARVGLDYHIQIEHHFYSVPYTLVREEVWVRISERLVEVLHNNTKVASHHRSLAKYRFSTEKSHMPEAHQAVRSWTADNFRAWAQTVGADTSALIELILGAASYKELGFRSILGLQRLAKKYGALRLEAAAALAIERRMPTQRFVRQVLELGIEKKPVVPTKPPVIHANIRGEKFYH